MGRSDRLDGIVAEYSPRLLGFIKSHVKCREDAEDILQDVFYQLARSYDDEDSGIERVSAWLYRVARNAVLNFWRKKREVTIGSFFDTEDEICEGISQTLFSGAPDEPDALYLRRLVWQELDQALAELPAEQSEVFCLTVFDGMPVRDISEATGVPVATLLSRKHYAVKHLRGRFHELYEALVFKD